MSRLAHKRMLQNGQYTTTDITYQLYKNPLKSFGKLQSASSLMYVYFSMSISFVKNDKAIQKLLQLKFDGCPSAFCPICQKSSDIMFGLLQE